MRTASQLVGLLVAGILLAACGGGQATSPADRGAGTTSTAGGSAAVSGNPATGQELFISQGCGGCHVIEGVDAAIGQVCPNLSTIATDATEIIASPDYTGDATTAAEYIRESIVDPNIYVVEGYQPNVMPQTFDQTLSEQQINDLVAFLMQQQ